MESLNGVISVVEKGGQYQVVIGNEVQSVFRAIQSQMKDVPSTSHEESDEEKGSIVNRIISVISTTFTPVIPALIGGGMIKAVLSILVLFNLVNEASSTYEIINFISDAPFYFMPVLLAYGASQKIQNKSNHGNDYGMCPFTPNMVRLSRCRKSINILWSSCCIS